MSKLTINFQTKEKRDEFTTWLLDAGGDDSYQDFLDFTCKDFVELSSSMDDDGEINEISIK